jgi:hypothetical protein
MSVEPLELLSPLSRADSVKVARRRRGRNWALLGVLIALVGLFYAITLVKIGQGTLKF